MTDAADDAAATTADAPEVPAENIASRAASLAPEELAAGSDDPTAQAAAILQESEERTADPTAGL